MTDLTSKKCVPCEAPSSGSGQGGTLPLPPNAIAEYLSQLKMEGYVVDKKRIKREFKFKDFAEAIQFVNKVAEIAEQEGHHPDIHIFYNKVRIELWTHAISGLSENDFILAAKIEKMLER